MDEAHLGVAILVGGTMLGLFLAYVAYRSAVSQEQYMETPKMAVQERIGGNTITAYVPVQTLAPKTSIIDEISNFLGKI